MKLKNKVSKMVDSKVADVKGIIMCFYRKI